VTGRPRVEPREVLAQGIQLEEGPPVRPVAWRFKGGPAGGDLEITLREGRSRVIRKMAARLGLGVRALVRVAYGPVPLGDLARGATRPLTRRELTAMYGVLQLPLPADG
jgi:23S rRNA pseudouridine2605 synthase